MSTEYKAREYVITQDQEELNCNGVAMSIDEVLKRLKEHEAAREALHSIDHFADSDGNLNIDYLSDLLDKVDSARQVLGGGEN